MSATPLPVASAPPDRVVTRTGAIVMPAAAAAVVHCTSTVDTQSTAAHGTLPTATACTSAAERPRFEPRMRTSDPPSALPLASAVPSIAVSSSSTGAALNRYVMSAAPATPPAVGGEKSMPDDGFLTASGSAAFKDAPATAVIGAVTHTSVPDETSVTEAHSGTHVNAAT